LSKAFLVENLSISHFIRPQIDCVPGKAKTFIVKLPTGAVIYKPVKKFHRHSGDFPPLKVKQYPIVIGCALYMEKIPTSGRRAGLIPNTKREAAAGVSENPFELRERYRRILIEQTYWREGRGAYLVSRHSLSPNTDQPTCRLFWDNLV
jgi:hypothetical protein